MNNKIIVLAILSFALIFEIVYVSVIYEPSYNFSCNNEFTYRDDESHDILDGNIFLSLNNKMQGHAEIIGYLTRNGGSQDIIRSVDFKYRVISPKKLVIYDARLVTYSHDSVEESFAPEPILDFLFFRYKDLKEININVNKVKNTYLFGRANNFVFACTS
ncbi:hypothetical protein [Hafnia paralvei]|uniref:hypothetical protein n=1 Tax=Hafnia paralvei TaxID=546367 RepID=UPI0037BE7746